MAHGVHQEYDTSLDPGRWTSASNRVGATFDDAKVRAFVPLLVRRYVRDELNDNLQDQQGQPANS